jgi:hypothetical protein
VRTDRNSSGTHAVEGLDMDAREKRMATNEALFREVNERIEVMAHQLGPEVSYEFLCECANADCTFKLALPLQTYEAIRADPKQFVVLPLHYTPEVEELVAEEPAHWIVRKEGEAGEYVAQLDPRARDR